jgi:hypothetical protein
MYLGTGLRITNPRLKGGGSPLLSSLVAYWKLEEASGTRVDTVQGLNLTDNGTVSQVAGKVNFASGFNGSTQWLSRTDSTGSPLAGGNTKNFTYSLWLKTTMTTQAGILCRGAYSGQDHVLDFDGTGKPRFAMTNYLATVTGPSTIGDGLWHNIIFWYDLTANRLKMRIDNGSTLTSAVGLASQQLTTVFHIGRYGSSDPTTIFFNGSVDEVGRWDRLFTTEDFNLIWNGGAGRTYPFLP